MKKVFDKIWAWVKFLFWLSALIIYAIIYAGPLVMSIFFPAGKLFVRK